MTLAILFVLLLPAISWTAGTADLYPPFQPGERLTYNLRWNFIRAGTAVTEVQPMTELNGIPACHFLARVRTSPFVDMLYKVRDRFEAYAAADMSHSLFFRKKLREGDYRRDVIVGFDWESKTSWYETPYEKRPPISIYPGTFDPLSICFYARMQDLEVGKVFQRPLSDGNKCVIATVKVVKREKIKVPCGEYDTFLVEPELKHLGGVFKRTKAATFQIWIASDGRHLPVKVKSKVFVGNFYAVLASVQ